MANTIIDHRKYNIVEDEQGRIIATPKPFLPNQQDVYDWIKDPLCPLSRNRIDTFKFLIYVMAFVNEKYPATDMDTEYVLKYSKDSQSVEPTCVFSAEHPFRFVSEKAASMAIAIIGQQDLISIYKV